jgi:hypothetical protein
MIGRFQRANAAAEKKKTGWKKMGGFFSLVIIYISSLILFSPGITENK